MPAATLQLIGEVFLLLSWVWVVCFVIALPIYLVTDLRNNRSHNAGGLRGWVHTLVRVPALLLGAPLYLWLTVASWCRPGIMGGTGSRPPPSHEAPGKCTAPPR
jgi:hypothetical protein